MATKVMNLNNKVPQLTLMYKLLLFGQVLCQEKLGAWLPQLRPSLLGVEWFEIICKSSPSVL